ncbi:hypothetical protein BGX34_002696 [Mortierella sp. NVP85]|nr:hypothetical protein BGX34_002696 [Mortierella sp. NVP85]
MFGYHTSESTDDPPATTTTTTTTTTATTTTAATASATTATEATTTTTSQATPPPPPSHPSLLEQPHHYEALVMGSIPYDPSTTQLTRSGLVLQDARTYQLAPRPNHGTASTREHSTTSSGSHREEREYGK